MATLAAIDVGSNAMRLAVMSVDAGRQQTVLEIAREPVRLGRDVFSSGVISERTLESAVEAFRRFRQRIDHHGATFVRAVATSATREAFNKDIFVDRIAQETNIDITPISPEEEARLIHLAVADRLTLKKRVALLVDIGGGSTEVTLAEGDSIISTESFKMGSVRLLQLRKQGDDERQFVRIVREYVEATKRRIAREIGDRTVDLCVGTGGNMDTLADLRRDVLGLERSETLASGELDSLLEILQGMTYEERVQRLLMRPDRADVIVPAAIIMREILRQADVAVLHVPGVGLKDGLLIDMVLELFEGKKRLHRGQVIASTLSMGRKFVFDEQHAVTVARHAVSLFDQTRPLHGLAAEHKLLLEVSALLHDIGHFVNTTDHHKHTQYLLMASPLIGLTDDQMAIVANTARYHRKSTPKPQHDPYRVLSSRNRAVVSKLAAILRLADAMDNEHAAKVHAVDVELRKPSVRVRLKGDGDLLLEKWAIMKKAAMFEEVYSVRLEIGD